MLDRHLLNHVAAGVQRGGCCLPASTSRQPFLRPAPCSWKHGVCRLASVCASSDKETMLLALREDNCSKTMDGVGALACRAGDSLGEAPGRSSNGPVARPDGVHFRCVKGS